MRDGELTDADPEESEPVKQDMFWGYMTVVGAVCIHLFCGALYLWGNIATYVVSYFHYNIDGRLGDPNATLKVAVAVMPIQVLMTNLINPVGAFLHK